MNNFSNEADFLREANSILNLWAERLERADEEGKLEVEMEGGILTIGLPKGRTYLLSRHAPSRELWISSPISGGLHFAYSAGNWVLADGRILEEVMVEELRTLAGVAL